MKEFSHKQLVEIGARWCNSRCGFVFKELVTMSGFGEIPDVIGFNSCGTFLLEAKTSRADFLIDKNKPFRKMPQYGMGDWRFYICKKGLVTIEELPEGWGLIEVNEKGKARIKHNPFGKGNIYSSHKKNLKNEKSEQAMMYSALRRINLRGLLDVIYEPQPINQ